MSSTTTVNEKELEDKFKDICGPTDPRIDRDARERLVTARIGLLLKQPFFGNLATRLTLTNADEWCPTAATDGRHLFYSVPFFANMSNKEIEFVIAHEILHCVFDHMTRREDRDMGW